MFHLINTTEEKASSVFPDKRLLRRYDQLDTMLSKGQSSILNRISINRKERKGGYDFFHNDRVTEQILEQKLYEKIQGDVTPASIEHVLVLGDTTEYNYMSNILRISDTSGLGTLSNESSLGFMAHVNLALNAKDLSVLGVSDLQLWHREEDRPRSSRRKHRSFEEKESYKWHVGVFNSHHRLKQAKQVTYIQDRDGDIYESILKVRELSGSELLVRSCRDRKILLENGTTTMLYGYLLEQDIDFSYELKIKSDRRKNRSGRNATMDVRSVRVKLVCPENLLPRQYAKYIEVDVIWARESPTTIPKGESAIDWKLITTHEVQGKEELIKQIIQWYANRWLIEEFFLSQKQELMILKMLYWKQGMDYEN